MNNRQIELAKELILEDKKLIKNTDGSFIFYYEKNPIKYLFKLHSFSLILKEFYRNYDYSFDENYNHSFCNNVLSINKLFKTTTTKTWYGKIKNEVNNYLEVSLNDGWTTLELYEVFNFLEKYYLEKESEQEKKINKKREIKSQKILEEINNILKK